MPVISATKEPSRQAGPSRGAAAPEAADLILRYLETLGIGYVFGVPGGAIEPLYNAQARSEARGGPRPIVARHECGAAFMADGYARETGKLGVCCATTGPGATNLITGVASAHQDNVPLLVLTAQTPLRTFGRGAVQESSCTEINTVEMLRHCTKYSSLVSHPDQLERKLAAAVMLAHQSPRGAVHLSIPLDLMRTPIASAEPRFDLHAATLAPQLVDEECVRRLAGRLASRHPVFLIGDGCREGASDIVRVAERLSAHFLATPQGKGLVDARHPLYKGVFGLAGHDAAYEAIADPAVDLVVAAGTRFDEIASRCWDERHLLTERLVHVDDNARNFLFSPMAQLHVHGNIRTVFQQVLVRLDRTIGAMGQACRELVAGAGSGIHPRRPSDHVDWRPKDGSPASLSDLDPNLSLLHDPQECLDASAPVKPQRLMHELSKRFPPGTRFLADIGNSFLWAIHYLHPRPGRGPDQTIPAAGLVRFSMGFSSMGWSVGGAVGTALGCPGTPVVSIVGDGSMLMAGQELTVAVVHQLPVIYVVLNDAALGTVKHGQRMAGAEQVGFDLPEVDFCQMARAQGAAAYRIGRPEDFDRLDIEAICGRTGPTVLDVRIDPDEAPPLKTRLETLRTRPEE